MAVARRGSPAVEELIRAAARAGIHIPGWGEPSGPVNGGAWNGQPPGQMKRGAGATPPRGGGSDMDSVEEEEWDRDLFGDEPVAPHLMRDARAQDPLARDSSMDAREKAMRLVQQGAQCWEIAPNQAARVAYGGNLVVLPPPAAAVLPPTQSLQVANPPAGQPMPRRYGPAARRGRSTECAGRRRRSASRSVVGRADPQQIQQAAIAQLDAHNRMQIAAAAAGAEAAAAAHGQAAAALVQRAPGGAPQPVTPVGAPEPRLSQPAARRRGSPSVERRDEVPVDDRSDASDQFGG